MLGAAEASISRRFPFVGVQRRPGCARDSLRSYRGGRSCLSRVPPAVPAACLERGLGEAESKREAAGPAPGLLRAGGRDLGDCPHQGQVGAGLRAKRRSVRLRTPFDGYRARARPRAHSAANPRPGFAAARRRARRRAACAVPSRRRGPRKAGVPFSVRAEVASLSDWLRTSATRQGPASRRGRRSAHPSS